MAQQFNFDAYGYMGVNPDIRQEGRGFSGRMLSLYSAAAKPREGPRTIRTQENFNRAMQYITLNEASMQRLIQSHGQANVDGEVLDIYKDSCLGLREALNLTEGVFEVKRERVVPQIAVPRQDIALVTEMIDDMKAQVAVDQNGAVRRPVTHINALCEEANRIIEEFIANGGVIQIQVVEGIDTYVLNNNALARNIVPLIPLRVVRGQNVDRRQQQVRRRSLWATALARLRQFQDNREDIVLRALAILKRADNDNVAIVDEVMEEFNNMINEQQPEQAQQQNRFSQMSNVDNVFNIYYWFWWLKTKTKSTKWSYREFQSFLNVVRAVYYSDVGAARARAILQNLPSELGRAWLNNSNNQESRFQAPWNPHFQRLRWLTLFVPTEVNRIANPETLSFGYETCYTNWRTENPEFWNLLTSVYVAENRERTTFSASEHTLHRLLVGFKSPLQNTQNVRGNALNVTILPAGGDAIPAQVGNNGDDDNPDGDQRNIQGRNINVNRLDGQAVQRLIDLLENQNQATNQGAVPRRWNRQQHLPANGARRVQRGYNSIDLGTLPKSSVSVIQLGGPPAAETVEMLDDEPPLAP